MTTGPNIEIGDYVIVKKIGKGSFSSVFECYHKTTKVSYAIKVIYTKNLNEKVLENLLNEIDVLIKIDHPNIIKLYDTFKTEKNTFLILEYCSEGDLYNYMKTNGKLSESESKRFFIQITQALYFLWMNNLIHRDIKPHNILLTSSGILKVADFGFVKYLENTTMMDTLCGSPLYMAPEILKYQKYNAKIDLWSMGVVLFEMLTNRPPFVADNIIHLIKVIETTTLKIPDDIILSKNCIDLLKSLLVPDPDLRISFEDFFTHKFFDRFRFEGEEEEPPQNIQNNNITNSIINEYIPQYKNNIEKYVETEDTQDNDDNYVFVKKNDSIFEIILSVKLYVESIYRCTSEVEFFGSQKEASLDIKDALCIYIKVLKLYEHAIYVCNNTISKYMESTDILQISLKLLKNKYEYILQKSEKIYEKMKGSNKYNNLTNADKLIYYKALNMTKEATTAEILDNNLKAIYLYIWSIRLFESLTNDEKPLDEYDSKIVSDFITSIKKRINFIQNTAKR